MKTTTYEILGRMSELLDEIDGHLSQMYDLGYCLSYVDELQRRYRYDLEAYNKLRGMLYA